jgi:aryl-alcohol dehydrogenase-like predicted oxidoreductase
MITASRKRIGSAIGGLQSGGGAQTWKKQLGSFSYRVRLRGHELQSRPRPDRNAIIGLICNAAELGVTFFDTAEIKF